jgi:hypothetical protein
MTMGIDEVARLTAQACDITDHDYIGRSLTSSSARVGGRSARLALELNLDSLSLHLT